MLCWKWGTSIVIVMIRIPNTMAVVVSTNAVSFQYNSNYKQFNNQQRCTSSCGCNHLHRTSLLRNSICLATTLTTTTTDLTDSNDDKSLVDSSSDPSMERSMSKMAHVDPLTCPFRSRYYPRIVPIPIRKRRKEEIQLLYNSRKLNNFWLPGQRTYIRNRFMQQQQQQQKLMQPNATCNVEWVNRITTSTSKYGNILALASLWDIVGNVTTNIQEQQSRVILDQNRIVRTVIALPDGDGYMIDQFVTMVQWLLERQQLHTQIFISYQNISIDFFMTIPTIVVTLHIPPTSSIPKQSTGSTERSFLEEQYTVKQSTTSTTTTISHDVITQRTKSWVQRVLVDTTICPFTKSITYSGQGLSDVNVPVGKIAYHTSHSSLQLVRGALDHDSQSVCTVTAAVYIVMMT